MSIALILFSILFAFGILRLALGFAMMVIMKLSECIAKLTGGDKEKISTIIIIVVVVLIFFAPLIAPLIASIIAAL